MKLTEVERLVGKTHSIFNILVQSYNLYLPTLSPKLVVGIQTSIFYIRKLAHGNFPELSRPKKRTSYILIYVSFVHNFLLRGYLMILISSALSISLSLAEPSVVESSYFSILVYCLPKQQNVQKDSM